MVKITPGVRANISKSRWPMGTLISKQFGGVSYIGTVTRILPVTDDGDCQLWHILYDDGDEEDLNVREMQKCRNQYLDDDDDDEYVDEE